MLRDVSTNRGILPLDSISTHILRPNIPSLVLMAGYIAFAMVTGRIFGFAADLSIYSSAWYIMAPALVAIVLCGASLVSLYRNRPERPTVFLRAKIAGDWKVAERAMRGLPVFLFLPVYFSAFTSFKSALSAIVPFYADPYAIALDRMIHGTDPWRLLQMVLGFPHATVVINFFYNLWFFATMIILSLAVFLVNDVRLRSQYLVAFILSWWIIGSVFAAALASVGPCFYTAFYSGAPYAELFTYLDQVQEHYPVPARTVQTMLLDRFRLNETSLGTGISALPSMHVAVAVLNGIFLSRINRYAGWAGWTFAAIIMIGSVHLGWHYAVDGYLAAILVAGIWYLSGWLSRKFLPEADGLMVTRSLA